MNSVTQQNLFFKSIHLTALHNYDLLKEQLSFNDPEPSQLQISSCSVAIRQEMACCTKLNLPNMQTSSTMCKTRRAKSWENINTHKSWFLTPRYFLPWAKCASDDRESPGSKRGAGGSEVGGLRLLRPGSRGIWKELHRIDGNTPPIAQKLERAEYVEEW